MRITARSPAERRALQWCLSIGVLAILLGFITPEGKSPSLVVRIEGWLPAKILALDLILVLAGGRAPRAGATAALVALGLLVALVGLVFLGSLFLILHQFLVSENESDAILESSAVCVMGVVQWLSFKAVAENDRLHG
jgi:hypothetical protein